jgi:predicted O-linked N-acetylglucosamine transferase (SPINDLY family)
MQRFREILELRPDHLVAHSNLLFQMSVDADTSMQAYLEEARRFDKRARRGDVPTFIPRIRQPGPIRLGFVSGDLRAHPVGYFLGGVLRHLDCHRFELHAYPTSVNEDALTAELRPMFRSWRQLKGVSDKDAIDQIRQDNIDVLFDLGGHTNERLAIFVARAAPLQVTWLGYFASTGVATMDYVLADDVCVPPGSESVFTERVWRLPETRLCFTPPDDSSAPVVAPPPSSVKGHVTFGCFQRMPKVTDRLLGLWSRILDAVVGSRLYLQSPQFATEAGLREARLRLRAAGIDIGRVTTAAPRARAEYLKAYAEVDIVLDTFPYTGEPPRVKPSGWACRHSRARATP